MAKSSENFIIEPMNEEQAEIAWRFAEQEGWNPGIDDHKILPLIDPEGCVAISVIDNCNGKKMVGCMSFVDWGGYGFVGMYIVKQEFRGRNFGRKLFRHFEPKLKKIPNIGLDGVQQKVRKYKTFGFRPAYDIGRYLIPPNSAYKKGSASVFNDEEFDAVSQYDRMVFGLDRKPFLKNWLSSKHADTAILKRSGNMLGFGVVRTCCKGRKIGPLFAENHFAAIDIIQKLIAFQPDKEHYIDVPHVAHGQEKIKSGLEHKFICTRMYLNEMPAQDVTRVFGNTTFEMG